MQTALEVMAPYIRLGAESGLLAEAAQRVARHYRKSKGKYGLPKKDEDGGYLCMGPEIAMDVAYWIVEAEKASPGIWARIQEDVNRHISR